MTSLQYILMLEAFDDFKAKAAAAGFQDWRIDALENQLLKENPIPQPQPMKV